MKEKPRKNKKTLTAILGNAIINHIHGNIQQDNNDD